jgi:hypothetical protein
MNTKSRLRGVALSILCCSIAACSKNPDAQRKVDPNVPAVVNLGPPILPSDTAKKPVVLAAWVNDDSLRLHVVSDYAVMTAALLRNDGHMIASMYVPDGELVIPGATKQGAAAIASTLLDLAKSKSLASLDRQTKAIHYAPADSTVIDSGTYQIRTSRTGGLAVVESGTYVTRWRAHPSPTQWTILRDELKPDRSARKKVN